MGNLLEKTAGSLEDSGAPGRPSPVRTTVATHRRASATPGSLSDQGHPGLLFKIHFGGKIQQ